MWMHVYDYISLLHGGHTYVYWSSLYGYIHSTYIVYDRPL